MEPVRDKLPVFPSLCCLQALPVAGRTTALGGNMRYPEESQTSKKWNPDVQEGRKKVPDEVGGHQG